MKTLYTASCKWRGPSDSEKFIYYAGITQNKHVNLKLVNSFDQNYPDNTAFKLVGTSDGDRDRVYEPSSDDSLIIYGIDSSISYGIDNDKSLVIFDENFPLTDITTDSNNDGVPNVHATLIKNFASLHKANSVSFERILDFRLLNERAITSMVETTNGIFMAGISGKVWFYNGYYIKGPIFYLDAGPASSLLIHRFEHETDDYLYVSSDKKPRLYRTKVTDAIDGKLWERLYDQGELNATTGGILSMVSAYNSIFIGARDKKVHKYIRTKEVVLNQPVNLITEEVVVDELITESLTTTTLVSPNLGDFVNQNFAIRAIESGKNQVFAAADSIPSVWSYKEIYKNNPESDEFWSSVYFNEVFRNDPAPAQYYGFDNITNSRSDSSLAVSKLVNSEPSKITECLVIKGNTRTATGATAYGSRLFEFSEGSDWEQLQAKILPDQEFINVQCASVSAITTFDNITSFDGYTLSENDYVLIKDQTSLGTNGIYNGIYQYINSNFVRYTPVILTNSTVLGFYIENGYVNGLNRYLVSVDDVIAENYQFYKPKTTVELELANLSYTQATQCTTLEECVYLNVDETRYTSTDFDGYQGLEIANSYGIVSLEFNDSNFVLRSGGNVLTKAIPKLGYIKEWLFSEDNTVNIQNWSTNSFVTGIAATTISALDVYENSYNKTVLRIEPALSGDPSITIDNLDLNVDFDSIINLRVKIEPKLPSGFPTDSEEAFVDSTVSVGWAYDSGEIINLSHVHIETSNDFVDYNLRPTWKGNISKLTLSFINLPELTKRPSNIYIDYIKIVNQNNVFDMTSSLSKVRIILEDRDVKVFCGKQLYPYINIKNFISADNYNSKYLDSTIVSDQYNKIYLKFGKLNNYAGDSMFAYSKLCYSLGNSYNPITKETYNFYHVDDFLSSGGVRMLRYHDGTLYAINDGIDSTKLNDNPDDRQVKIFKYDSTSESWQNDTLAFDRVRSYNNDGSYDILGIIRPIDAISYKGKLYISGQYGSIK